MSRLEVLVFVALVLVAASCALAGDPPAAATAAWKKGDTWTVHTLQRELALVPRAPTGPRIPGAPPRKGGVAEGWKHANRWRLTVDRVEDGVTVILLESLEGTEKRRTQLHFKAGKLVRIGERRLTRTTNLVESRELGFPLDWPEKFAEWKAGVKWWSSFECAGLRGELEP